MYSVYLHIAPNNKCYCGITMQEPQKRWANGKGYSRNPHFYKAIQKYGWDNIKHFVIAEGLSREEAGLLEKAIIKTLDLTNKEHGYNNALGGEFGAKFTDETKEKMRQKASAKWEDEAYRENQIAKRIGTKMSEATKNKISVANKGKKRTEETKQLMSSVQKGIPHKPHKVTEETKAKISASKKGKHFGGKGATAQRIVCVETGIVYESAKDASSIMGGNYRSINNVCKNGKTYKGFHWQYAN